MTLDTRIAVDLLEPTAADDTALINQLADLVNEVYAVAESGMWQEGATRTTPSEMALLVAAGEIAAATTRGGSVVGCIRVHDAAADVGEFGLLASAVDHRGAGIGRSLKDLAERRCRDRGMPTMQLELLVPREWRHPSKEFLKSWYGRSGYRLVRVGRIEDAYPHLAPLLATPCDLEIHQKPLQTDG